MLEDSTPYHYIPAKFHAFGMKQWRIQGGGFGGTGPPFGFFFVQKRSLLAKISIKQVGNLFQNAGNGHFRDSNFQKYLGDGGGGMHPDPLESSCLQRLLVPPLLKIVDPPL